MLSLHQLVSSYVCMPLAYMMGVSYEDSFLVGELLGLKTFLTEFVAYEKLATYIKRRKAGGPLYVGNVKQYLSVSQGFIFYIFRKSLKAMLIKRVE